MSKPKPDRYLQGYTEGRYAAMEAADRQRRKDAAELAALLRACISLFDVATRPV